MDEVCSSGVLAPISTRPGQLPDGNLPLLGSLVGVPGHEETILAYSRSDVVKQLAHTAILPDLSNVYNGLDGDVADGGVADGKTVDPLETVLVAHGHQAMDLAALADQPQLAAVPDTVMRRV
jgi:hypothetical protein